MEPSGFHGIFATKPGRSEAHEQNNAVSGNDVSIGDSWSSALSGSEHRVAWETLTFRA